MRGLQSLLPFLHVGAHDVDGQFWSLAQMGSGVSLGEPQRAAEFRDGL